MQPTAVGYRMVVELDPVEEKDGILYKPVEATDKEKYSRNEGVVVGMGEFCFDKYPRNWCKLGDRVLFAMYSGEYVEDKENGKDYRVLNDLDIMAVLP